MKKSNLITLIVLVVLIATYFLLKTKDSKERTRDLISLDINKLDSIEIWDSENRIHLIPDEGVWKLKDPVLWPADTLMVNSFLQEIVKAEFPSTPMSEGKHAVSRYDLEEDKAMHIRLKAGSKSEHLLFGNIGNAWDYFRREGEDTVYQTRTRIIQQFSPIIMNWRNPLVIHYWEDDLATIRVEHPNNKYTLTRNGLQWTFKDAKHDFEVVNHNFALTKIVGILQNFRSYSFVSGEDDESRALFEKPVATVWITDTKGKTNKLCFAEYSDKRYVMLLNDDYSVLYHVEFDTVFRFTRNPEIFMRKSII